MVSMRTGDRISIRLPERVGPSTRYPDVAGEIIDFDLPGQPLGVLIKLDRPVNGVDTCYATRDEVKKPGR